MAPPNLSDGMDSQPERPDMRTHMIAYIRKPSGGMPPYTSKVMSDADVADVHAYLTTIPEPPPLKNIPLLNP